MADNKAIPTQDEIAIARSGLTAQAEAKGLNLNDPNIAAFIEGQVQVQAHQAAELRLIYSIMHKNIGIK